MRAVVVRSYGGPEALEIVEMPVPEPGRGQIRIRVEAAAVNPVDIATREGLMNVARPGVIAGRGQVGIGWDVAGIIEATGPDVTGLAPADRVIGLRDRLDQPLGTYAGQVVLDAADTAPAPAGNDAIAASTIPLNGLTAVQALDALALPAGQTILVTGAAGGLGGFGTELAAMRGLRVIAAAGDADEEHVRDLGAAEFVPRSAHLATAVRDLVPGGVDAVFDAAVLGYPALDAVRPGGSFATFVGTGPVPLRGIRIVPVTVHADGAALAGLSRLAAAGKLTLRVADTYPLAEAAKAHQRLQAGGVRGRLVLVP
ncbi:MAG TPA: NADP-dependent oxidoreductase [Streptosporangiaceae bacterium]|nr:NADP-dependent oxidoreductase [Streptosporangiaceae bacterium]